jgi:general secretion pathway protein H
VNRAFTLFELLVVLLLVSLLAGLVFPRIAAFIPHKSVFPLEAMTFIENARFMALAKHQNVLVVFSPEARTISLKILSEENPQKGRVAKTLSVPDYIEVKAEGLMELPGGRWGILFLANGASSGGEVEVVDRESNLKLVCRLARSQFLVEVVPE